MIDKNGPAPKGTGIKQLRENIAESKLSYEIMDDAAQAFLKTKIMDNIQKYFYLICFTAYLRDMSKVAKDGVSEEEKKAFSLTGGKGESNNYFKYSCQVWSLTQLYSVDFSQSRSDVKRVFSTNAQSRFASVVVDGVLGPPRLVQHT